ncbi:MAG: NTP transferase domain-containing protein, partial [Rhodanobacteraceae bacterium]
MTAVRRASLLGVILAGGEGRRMHGADKGLQPVGEQSLVACVHAAMAPQVDEVMISANRNIDAYAAIAPTW